MLAVAVVVAVVVVAVDQPQVEEVRRTGDARVIVADRLLASAGEPYVIEIEPVLDEAEQAIRNYDPCISCATHFLDLRVDRR